jgi:hypothetical protein
VRRVKESDNRAEREEREEHRKRMERLRGAKPERKGGR